MKQHEFTIACSQSVIFFKLETSKEQARLMSPLMLVHFRSQSLCEQVESRHQHRVLFNKTTNHEKKTITKTMDGPNPNPHRGRLIGSLIMGLFH